jgi:ribosomal protein L37AE/L43A
MKDEFGNFENEKYAMSDELTCPNCKSKFGLELKDEKEGLSYFYCNNCGTNFVGAMMVDLDPKIEKLAMKSARKKRLRGEFCCCFMCGEAFATDNELIQHQNDMGHAIPSEKN